jgi:hypothetical protein
MMRLCTLLFALLSINAQSQVEYHFAISLMPTYQGVISYGIVTVQNGEVTAAEPLNEQIWMRQAAGDQLSKANPSRSNVFLDNQVDSAWVLYDSIYWTYGKKKFVGTECIPCNLMWKLRYKEHPYVQDNTGWAGTMYSPSPQQMDFLREAYGLKHLDGYIWGPNLWRLMREIQLPVWQNFYRGGGTIEQYLEYFVEGGGEEGEDGETDPEDEDADDNDGDD